MADATTARFICEVQGGKAGDKEIKALWTLNAPILFSVDVTIISTTTVTWGSAVAASGTLCIVIPPKENVFSLRIDDASGKRVSKNTPFIVGVEGDTGISLQVTGFVEVPVTVIVV